MYLSLDLLLMLNDSNILLLSMNIDY